MSNNKQTAVEWLWEQIDNSIPFQNIQTSQIFNGLLEQAKAMEKEQMDKISEDKWVEGCAYMKDGKRIYESLAARLQRNIRR